MNRYLTACLLLAVSFGPIAAAYAEDRQPLTIVVMDPLALPLSCPCVKGRAQRLYDKLGAYLEKQLDRPVKVLYADDLSKVLRNETNDIDVIIGKRSVVEFDAKIGNMAVRPAMMLAGNDGATTLEGLIVVRKDDPAKKLEDLQGYKILFGPPECDEKFKAAAAVLQKAGVILPPKFETRPGCSDSVVEMLENPDKPMAAVISSYAAALLEGCGTIEKGSIRIVGQTRPVPFVTVFYTGRLDKGVAAQVSTALAAVKDHADLAICLETILGFVPVEEAGKTPRDIKPPQVKPPVVKVLETSDSAKKN